MGNCLCKGDNADNDGRQNDDDLSNNVNNEHQRNAIDSTGYKFPTPGYIDKLMLELLDVIGSLVDNEQEPPQAMQKLHNIADKEEGWIQVVSSMVNVIPMDNPLGPSVITLMLDDCPLPSRDSVIKLSQVLKLSQKQSKNLTSSTQQRNICIVLGCIAERLAGPSSIAILSDDTLDYIISNIKLDVEPYVILFSLISLEKFAQTSENKITIKKRLISNGHNPLLDLEKWADSKNYVKRQVGFCARWSLDNLFLIEGRKYSHDTVDMTGINVMLNTKDVSEYLKISPNGLEARCDACSFESVRCTFQVSSGVWYYETLIVTAGVMQIGWATKESTFLNHEGYGIGDDQFSLSFDGCRRLIWHNAKIEKFTNIPCWKPGDILGCLLDLEKQEIIFSLNGVALRPSKQLFKHAKGGFFAAGSFMSFQQCLFNFGNGPFRYAPKNRAYQTFNDHATLDPEDKIVLPRHIFLDQLRKQSVREDSCTICFDRKANVTLLPCRHKGFCQICSKQLIECPMCRTTFTSIVTR